MKFSLSKKTLKKILIGTTIVNYILLVAYGFLLISALFFENYAIFMLSLPAYIFSRSWILIAGLFGFEILLLAYYKYKDKKNPDVDESNITEIDAIMNDNVIIIQENLDDLQVSEIDNSLDDLTIDEMIEENNSNQPSIDLHITSVSNMSSQERTQAELDFDKLWEEAIDHVQSATDKKKAGEQLNLEPGDKTLEGFFRPINKNEPKIAITQPPQRKKNEQIDMRKKKHAVVKKLTGTKGSPSVLQPNHRELFNEIALNNWIYRNAADREKFGVHKTSLDESKYREKDIEYLIEAGVLYKLLIPYPKGSFVVYSLYETEDKKIIRSYLTKICKKQNLKLKQKTISLENYQEYGLDKKSWRFDFQINNDILGLIWTSNYLIADSETKSYSLAFTNKSEIKAILAAIQTNNEKEKTAVIISDYADNTKEILDYLESKGYGVPLILPVGESNFEDNFLEMLTNKISV
ncbi:MAG: hypothetical protein ACTSO7_12090 [Candidatus Heimdallarchaeota archaeon]